MSQGKRTDSPISSKLDVLNLLARFNGSTIIYLAHCTDSKISEQSFYKRLQRLEKEGYVKHIVDPFSKRITFRYFLTRKAYDAYFAERLVFTPYALLPELKYLHGYRRNWSETYTPSDYEHNSEMLESLFPHSEAMKPVIADALKLYDALGQGLGFLYEGKHAEAAIMLDAAAHTMVPKLIGWLHAICWTNHVMNDACIEARRLLDPGPGKVMSVEEAHEIREQFMAAFAQSLQARDVDWEALEVSRKLSEVTHAKQAAEGKSALDRRMSDMEAERIELERQQQQFETARAPREAFLADQTEFNRMLPASAEQAFSVNPADVELVEASTDTTAASIKEGE